MPALTDIIAIADGCYNPIALKGDGTVVGLLNGTTVSGLSNVTAIAAGCNSDTYVLALLKDGTVSAFNASNNSLLTRYAPFGLANVTAIAAADHVLALTTMPAIQVTISILPPGYYIDPTITIDGVTYDQISVYQFSYSYSISFMWVPGSTHTIGTTSPQQVANIFRYAFSYWSDGDALTHTVAPTSPVRYIAAFQFSDVRDNERLSKLFQPERRRDDRSAKRLVHRRLHNPSHGHAESRVPVCSIQF